jgi:predicted secreted protein
MDYAGLQSITSQKTVLFIVTAVRTLNPTYLILWLPCPAIKYLLKMPRVVVNAVAQKNP